MSVKIANQEAFFELQQKHTENSRLLNQVLAKQQYADREKRRAELTLKELADLPAGTKTYKAVGKMFLYSPVNSLATELKEEASKFDSDGHNMTNQRKYLENALKECEKSIKELIIKD